MLPKLLLIALLGVLASNAALSQSIEVKDGKVNGPGFDLILPPGVTVDVGANSESAHGFYLALPPPQAADTAARTALTRSYRYIAFECKWDTGDMPSLQAAVDSVTNNLGASIPSYIVGSSDLVLDGNFPARLGTLPARRLVLKFKNTLHKPAIRQVIIAYHARPDASAIVYFLVLNTTEQNFQEDLSVFGKILAGFKVTGQ